MRRKRPGLAAALRAACLAALAAAPSVAAARQDCAGPGPAFASLYADPAPFDAAIAAAAGVVPSATELSGVTVPHHLLADHLIAEGLKAASAGRYRRIVLLFPDHFRAVRGAFATTGRDLATVHGRIAVDAAAAGDLLARAPDGLLDGSSCLFGRDHGLQALLPFVKSYFPDTPVLPVAISVKSRRADWDAMAALLAPLAGEGTLVMQSTDFSHFLPHHEARQRDQQTLTVLAAGRLDQVAALSQPGHADSVGALVIQEALQRRRGAAPMVVANENGQEYDSRPVSETTSYMVVLYGRFPADAPAPDWPRSRLVYLAGDTAFGRFVKDALLRESASDAIAEAVLSRTGGRPLMVNLEGVILPNVPSALDDMTLAMPEDLAIAWMKRLKIVAAGLANNHARDLGDAGLAETRRALDAAGIVHAGQGEVVPLAGLDVVALSDLGQNGTVGKARVTEAMLDALAGRPADRPLVAFVHWGEEFAVEPGARERDLALQLARRSFAAIVGAHPHVASPRLDALAGGDALQAYSLGNFIFDQSAPSASGALLEIRSFGQGTFFARLLPLPNLFDLGRDAAQQPANGPSKR